MKRRDVKIPISMVGEDEHILDLYRDLIIKGESPGIASILATRSAPALETATNHFVGQKPMHEIDGMKDYAATVRRQAKAAGIVVGEHSVYNGTVADARAGGDPAAWMHNGESPDKFRKACEARGKDCEGLRTKIDYARLSENEAKREAGIKKRNARRVEIASERLAKRRKMAGV